MLFSRHWEYKKVAELNPTHSEFKVWREKQRLKIKCLIRMSGGFKPGMNGSVPPIGPTGLHSSPAEAMFGLAVVPGEGFELGKAGGMWRGIR